MSGGAQPEARPPHGRFPAAWRVHEREAARGSTISGADTQDDYVHLVQSGWACRSKLLADGRRQILALLLPGELCGLRERAGSSRGVAVCAVTPCRLLVVPRDEALRALDDDVELAAALRGAMARQDAIGDEFIVSLGRRSGVERLAHLMCDLLYRQHAVLQDAPQPPSCEVPLTQSDLSDMVGLSVVHVNRSLQALRRSGMIHLERGRLTALDLPALSNLALYDAA